MRVYHYLEAKWALDDIRRRRLKLSKTDDMNDPYEWKCVRSSNKPSQEALERTEKDIAERHGALCFSRSWNNILMWSHYADRHQGVCLGFDIPKKRTKDVKYVGNVQQVGNLQTMSTRRKVQIVNRLNFAKYEGWCYEQEVRVKGSREEKDEETGHYFVNFNEHLKLKEVIAGARFPMSKGPIEDALKGYSEDVKIVNVRPATSKFEVVVDERGFDG